MRCYGYICVVLMVGVGLSAQSMGQTYNLGVVPTEAEIKAADTLVDPDGKLLPEGRGTAKEGGTLYAQRCAMCHGPNGEGTDTLATGVGPRLIVQDPSEKPAMPMGNDWDSYFSTTLFSYIRRVMPLHQAGTLTVDQVYALMAFLLYRNGLIGENEVMNPQSLPQVKLPNRKAWSPPMGTG